MVGQEMPTRITRAPVARDEPVSYKIQVQGHLSQTWADYLGGMAVSTSSEGERTVTTLSGQAADQAALMGILNSLSDLGLPLLSVENRSNPREEATKD